MRPFAVPFLSRILSRLRSFPECHPRLQKLLCILFYLVYFCFGVWCSGILIYGTRNLPESLSAVLALVLFLTVLLSILFRKRFVPFLPTILLILVLIFLPWSLRRPSNDRDWQPSFSRNPYAVIDGDKVTVYHVRNFRYRTTDQFDVIYETRTYRLSRLRGLDFALSHWDGISVIGHTMFSFDFGEDGRLALSVETRLAQNVEQGTFQGIFKQYEVLWILADERDLFGLRTNYRKEELYVYPLNVEPEAVRTMFLGTVAKINRLKEKPEFYNTLTENCTTSLISLVRLVAPKARMILLNGNLDLRAWRHGVFKFSEGVEFNAYQDACHINRYVEPLSDLTDYSSVFRQGIRETLRTNRGK